ncbi:MAG: tetratricopeptide repeat protein, partial [Pseudonocardiaceae bacterium]
MSADPSRPTPHGGGQRQTAAVQPLVVSRTGEVHQSGVEGVAVVNTGLVGRDLTVSVVTATQAFWTEAFPAATPKAVDPLRRGPSGLLAAASRVVEFIGRAAELAELTTWRDLPSGLAVMLIHGPGGQGKTRLAAAFAAQCANDGWAVSQARHHTDPRPPIPVLDQATQHHGLLVVVDYAERWLQGDLERLFQDRFLYQGVPTRLLMLARLTGYWWKGLRHSLFKLNARADELPLGPLADTVAERQIAFDAARNSFAQVLGATHFSGLRPAGSLTDDAYQLALTLHMAALVAVDAHLRGATPPSDPDELSAYLLDREHDHWSTIRRNGQISLSAPTMGRVVGVATLTRPLPTPSAADVLTRVNLADSPATAQPLLDDHAICYPPTTPGTALEPLFPDRLGEDFLARLLPNTHANSPDQGDGWAGNLLTRLLLPATGETPPAHATTALTVLIETGSRWQHVRYDYLYPLLRQHPQLVVEAGGPSLVTLADYADIDLLHTLDPHLPQKHVDLDTGIAALTRRLTDHGLAQTIDELTQAALYMKLALRAGNAGFYDEALAATQQAVEIRQRLAQANPAAYEPDLASSLNSLGVKLSKLGQHREALAATQQAVEIRQRLAQANPAAYDPDLASSLHNLGVDLSKLGQHREALAAADEAVQIRRRLAQANPAAYEPDLALSLHNLGNRLSELGQYRE